MFQRKIKLQAIDGSWRNVAAQSERQFGAFVFLYALEFGRPPKLLDQKWIELRNEVIHKGKIPTKDEALQYGQDVLDVVRPILREMQERLQDGVKQTVNWYLAQNRTPAEQGRTVGTMWRRTIIRGRGGRSCRNCLAFYPLTYGACLLFRSFPVYRISHVHYLGKGVSPGI